MHWFVDNFALYTGSVRGLFVSDFTSEYDAYIESTVINLRARGIEPFLTIGEQIVAQAEHLWAMATAGTTFGQPQVSMFELDMLQAEVAIIKDLEAPVTPQQLWYLYHYVIYPRALFNKATVITTSLGMDEFIAYGAECEDVEYGGRKISWEKLIWLIEATMIDLYQFRQVKTEGHPPMLKAEYNLFNAMNERQLPVTAQQVLGDYMLDMSIADRDNRLAIECDVLSSLDPNVPNSGEAKKNLVLLSDGWKILRFTAAEILGDLTACVDAVEQVWTQGRKKSAVGRLMSGRDQPKIPELPVDDDSQKFAITHGAGPVAVTGGAGTGKTSCVSHRIGYLLAQGVNPERILVFSHSEETIAQLKRKVEILTDAATVQRINFSDWKDLGLRILKENATVVKRKPPLKLESAPHRVLQRVLKKELKDMDPLQLELMEADIDEASIGSLISLYKANLVTPERIKEKATTDEEDLVAKLYLAYEEALRKSNKIDPDDTISLTAQILADDPGVRAKYQHKYEYVLIDEYQDCTAAADLMARLLAFPQDNLFLVGDEDECVTETKGALPRMMADTSIRMPNARCYILDKNWRSHPAIVDHSRSLAAALTLKGIMKDMIPGFGTAATSAVIGPQQCRSEEAEADWVANEVSILVESGKSPNDIVLLWRTPRYASLLEAALFKKNIKCKSDMSSSEVLPDEVGDVMAFLRLVMDPDGPKARESFERFCQLKSREMDQKLSKLSNTIASFAEANNLSFLKAIEIYHDATADSSCEDLAQLVRIVRTMHQESLPPSQTIGLLKRTQRLNEIYSAVKVPPGVVYEPMRKVEQLEEEAKAYSTVREFVKAKQDFIQNKDVSADESTVHVKSFEDAKGSEYPIAFLTGMAEGICPADAAMNFEEERRLCYVAMTRAKELLYISYPATFEEKQLPPSPFLVEARLLPINVYRKAVDLLQAHVAPKPAQAEPVAPGSGMLTPIMTGKPDRSKPAAGRDDRGNQGASPGGPQQGQGGNQTQRPAAQARGGTGNRPGSDVADLLGGRISAPGSGAPAASGSQPIIRPAGHSASLERGAPLQPTPIDPTSGANPFVGPEVEQFRQIDEARMKALNEARLKAQYEAHVAAQQQAQQQAELERQKREEQTAYLRMRHEQQLREAQEAALRAQQEEYLRRAQEEEQRRARNEPKVKAQEDAILRAQQEAELQLQQEAAFRAQQEAILREQQAAELLAQQEAELAAQSEAEAAEAQRQAHMQEMISLVQQEAAQRAQQEAALLAQQQAEAQRVTQQQAEEQARQQAALQAQQQAEEHARQQAALQAQEQARQQAALQAQQQAEEQAQRQQAAAHAEEQARQQAALQAQQHAAAQAEENARQQAALQAQHQAAAQAEEQARQQTALLNQQQAAEQQAALQAQQQAAWEAQQIAAMQAQQQAEMQAREQAKQQADFEAAQLQAQKEAKKAADAAQHEQIWAQEEAYNAQQQQIRAQQQDTTLLPPQQQPAQNQFQPTTNQDAAMRAQNEAQRESSDKAKQDALSRVQEKATQRALVDLELRMRQEAELRAQQPAAQDTVSASGPSPAAQQAGSPGEDINKLVDEQFNFAASAASSTPSQSSVDREEIVRSNKEILEEMSPEERAKQQDILRKKAREKISSKGRKKKGAAAEPEPVVELAPAAKVESTSKDKVAAEPALPAVPERPSPKVETPPVEPVQTVPAPNLPPLEQSPPEVQAPAIEPAQAQPSRIPPYAQPPNSAGPDRTGSAQQDPPAFRQPDFTPAAESLPETPSNGVPPPTPNVYGVPSPSPTVHTPSYPEQMPAAAQTSREEVHQPQVFGDPGMVGGAPSQGVTVHKSVDQGTPIPDLNQLIASQSPTWPQAKSEPPPAVQAPMPPQPANQGGFYNPPNAQMPGYATQPVIQPVSQPTEPVFHQVIPKHVGATCPQCAAHLEPNARFCGECGLHLQVRISACPSCNLPLEPSAKFCGECGHHLS